MVECNGLENRQGATPRGFESHLLRHDPRSITQFSTTNSGPFASKTPSPARAGEGWGGGKSFQESAPNIQDTGGSLEI